MNAPTGRHRAQPPARGRRMTTFVGITLIAVGAMLLNVHVTGVVLILAGAFCLLVSALVGAASQQQRPLTGLNRSSEDDRFLGSRTPAPWDARL